LADAVVVPIKTLPVQIWAFCASRDRDLQRPIAVAGHLFALQTTSDGDRVSEQDPAARSALGQRVHPDLGSAKPLATGARRRVSIMSGPSFSAVVEAEQASVFATLVLAFAADPVERWLYPEPQQYLCYFPKFLAAFGGGAFAEQTVWRLDAFSAVALWLPPGTEPDGDAITTTLAGTVSQEQHDDMFAVLSQMDAAHPSYPHWYLPWFGVDTALQGKGLGGQLMKPCLQIVDASHLPAYLETPNPRTIPFYERHGFEITGKAQAGACPPITFMLRAAR
jgi:GNAT superfamily N-acetyltransferase